MSVEILTPREQAFEAIRRLHLPASLTADGLVALVSSLTGKPIQFHDDPRLMAFGVCGCWLNVDDSHVIVLAPLSSPFHKQQTVLHELSHIILSHFGLAQPVDAIATTFRHLKPSDVQKALRRSTFDTPNELAAEFLADLLANEIRLGNRSAHRFFEVFG